MVLRSIRFVSKEIGQSHRRVGSTILVVKFNGSCSDAVRVRRGFPKAANPSILIEVLRETGRIDAADDIRDGGI